MGILPQLVANGVIAGAIYTLLALGFNLIFSTVRFFDLGYGALTAVGGYAVFFVSRILGANIFLAVGLGIIAAGIVGYLVNKFAYEPLRKRNASSMVLLVASLGIFTALQAIVAILFTSQFRTLSSAAARRTFEVAGGIITEVQLIILVVGVIITAGLALLLKKTKFGKAVRAVSDDEEVAKIVGVNTDKVIGAVFLIGSAIAGLAGILVGFDTGIEPTMGLALLLKGVIAAIVGGIGNVFGAPLGGFLLGFVENFGIWQLPAEWKDAIAFGLLIIFLLFRPRGILKR